MEAEDLTQEVFIRLAGRDDKQVASAEAFIFQTAANLLRDRARRHQVRSAYLATIADHADRGVDMLDPLRYAVARDELATLAACLDELPERMRRIFMLYRFENVAKPVIADSYGISVSNVEKQVASVMAFVAERMKKRS
jgi:RNA polymerase sigma-70 factor (ECF subfamily)